MIFMTNTEKQFEKEKPDKKKKNQKYLREWEENKWLFLFFQNFL